MTKGDKKIKKKQVAVAMKEKAINERKCYL